MSCGTMAAMTMKQRRRGRGRSSVMMVGAVLAAQLLALAAVLQLPVPPLLVSASSSSSSRPWSHSFSSRGTAAAVSSSSSSSSIPNRLDGKFCCHDGDRLLSPSPSPSVPPPLRIRGGAAEGAVDDDDNDDDERYSRQLYTLGAKAQRRIRKSTVFVDGPAASGLVYETAKNLALSGVRNIVFVRNDGGGGSIGGRRQRDGSDDEAGEEGEGEEEEEDEEAYHNAALDDLGNAYMRAARAEIRGGNHGPDSAGETGNCGGGGYGGDVDDYQLLKEYTQRLNPSVSVSVERRADIFADGSRHGGKSNDDDEVVVVVAIDRPEGTQLMLNLWAREGKFGGGGSGAAAKFVSIETAGVHGKIFCDFGDSHRVDDADGETPLVTPLDRVELAADGDDEGGKRTPPVLTVHCVEGEKHDVSKGDAIQFQFRTSGGGDGAGPGAASATGSDGDASSADDGAECVVTDVQTPYRFRVELRTSPSQDAAKVAELFVHRINRDAAAFARIKAPQMVSFEPLDVATDRAFGMVPGVDPAGMFTACDLDKSFDPVRRLTAFACFSILSNYLEKQFDEEKCWSLVEEHISANPVTSAIKNNSEQCRSHFQNFIRGCDAKLSPLQCVFGAIGAQEALKAMTGLYYPTHQFLLYDCDEVLSTATEASASSSSPITATKISTNGDCVVNKVKSKHASAKTGAESGKNVDPLTAPGLRHILGDSVVNKLQSQRLFLVGAGAIGCEILKNLASMGIGTRKKGRISLTDMDSIEKSNLSRQLLFRDSDLGKFKSTAAHEAALRFHPGLNIESHSSRVGATNSGAGGHTPFDDKFWSKKVNVVLNALDNVEARLYMDSQCVSNKKALVDAGTMGPKGNVQVVVPDQSESYASSADPPEPAIPVCTLKNFPYAISHTIQWGRELFDGLFERRPNQANDFLDALASSDVDELVSRLVSEKGDDAALEAAEELREDLSSIAAQPTTADWQACRGESLAWASKLASSLFYKAAEDLLLQHPLDSVDEDGEPFWSGTRRPPKALSLVVLPNDPEQSRINENLVDFVKAAARLRLETFAEDGDKKPTSFTTEETAAFLTSFNGEKSSSNDTVENESDKPPSDRVRALLGDIPSSGSSLQTLRATEFEKDDDSNGHVAFVNAASNLRAIAYGIPPVDAMETRRVAGNIVPAMITTTAFVSALSCIELIKLAQKAPLRLHRNAFVNLALPFFAFTVPLPAEEMPGLKGQTFTIWDRLTVKEGKKAAASGGMTLRSFLRRIKKLLLDGISDEVESFDVASVSCGPFMLYMNFLHEDDEDVLESSLWELIETAASSDATDEDMLSSRDGDTPQTPVNVDCSRFVDLAVVVEDQETGEEVELPVVRLHRYAA